MKNFISGMIGLCSLFMMVYTPVYILFFNSASDAVKSVSLEDGIYFSTIIAGYEPEAIEKRKKFISDVAKEYKKHTGIDISEPIYNVLENSSKIKNLSLKEDMPIPMESEKKLYKISFELDDRKFTIPFIVEEPSYTKARAAKAYMVLDIREQLLLIGPIYNISKDDLQKMLMLFDLRISNR